MADYNQLKTAIAEVIRTNGNEEITGEVLQYVLIEMVSALGKDFQLAGVGTPETEPGVRDENCAWLLGAGTYNNFGTAFVVEENELGVVMFNGSYTVRKITVGRRTVNTIQQGGTNPVEGGVIYNEFASLRAAGYLFAGLALPQTEPPTPLTEKIFYISTQAGTYPHFGVGGLIMQKGIGIIKWNGSQWSGEMVWIVADSVTDGSQAVVTSDGLFDAFEAKVDKEQGMGLSQESFTSLEKVKLTNLPTAAELAAILELKQNVLTFDAVPTQGSENPVTSGGIHEAIKNFITRAVDDLLNYYTKSQTYTKTEVDAIVAAIKQFNILAVPELPTASASTMGTLYLVPSERQGAQNVKDEYITLSMTEGGTTTYYWEKIGTTEIDLSNYVTYDAMNAAIAEALASYYTKTQVDGFVNTIYGTLANITLTANKEVLLNGESVVVALTLRSNVSATSISISRGGNVVGSGSGTLLQVNDTVQPSAAGVVAYEATVVIGGVTRTVTLEIPVVDAVYYGAGADASEVRTAATARLTPRGRYTFNVSTAGSNIFVLVPNSMNVEYVTMGGLELPLDTVTGVLVDGKNYKCYKSSNTYEVGAYTINVY